MKVIIGCEYSGIVRDAFIKRGYDAISCDLLDTESPGPHYKGDIFDLLKNNHYDLGIFHPPCTHLAVSGAASFYRKKQQQIEALQFVNDLMNANIKYICIENPVSIISSKIRKPEQIVQPYYFGDPYPKKTCLWLKNLPILQKTNIVEPEYKIYKSKKNKSGFSKYSPLHGILGKGKGKQRSKFFPGIAAAMAEQWGAYVENQLKNNKAA